MGLVEFLIWCKNLLSLMARFRGFLERSFRFLEREDEHGEDLGKCSSFSN